MPSIISSLSFLLACASMAIAAPLEPSQGLHARDTIYQCDQLYQAQQVEDTYREAIRRLQQNDVAYEGQMVYPAMFNEGLDPSPCRDTDRVFEYPIQLHGLWDGSRPAYSDRVLVAQYYEGGYGRCGVISHSNGLHRCKAIGA